MDFVAEALNVRCSSWRGIVGTPKSGRERKVPLTARLKAALEAHRHLKSELVFCHSDGKPFTQSATRRRSNSVASGWGCGIGSQGAPAHLLLGPRYDGRGAEGDQELVGHSTLSMTLRYMHLAPSALTEAIGLLNFGQPVGNAEAATG